MKQKKQGGDHKPAVFYTRFNQGYLMVTVTEKANLAVQMAE